MLKEYFLPKVRARCYREAINPEGKKVQGVGPKGITAVLKADSTEELQRLSEYIEQRELVVDFNPAYLNWDDNEEDQM